MEKRFNTVDEVRAWLQEKAPLPGRPPESTPYTGAYTGPALSAKHPPYVNPMAGNTEYSGIDSDRVARLLHKPGPSISARRMAGSIKSMRKLWARMAACEARNWSEGAKIFYDRWVELDGKN